MLRNFFKKKQSSTQKIASVIKKCVRNGAKDILTGNDTLSISGAQKYIKEEINKNAYSVIKEAIENPEIMLDYIKSRGTIIVKFKYMDKILLLFGDEPGFIPPKTGLNALFFALIINTFSSVKINTGFATLPLFALKDEPVNIYTMAHQFHLWLSYINYLPGFEEKTLRNFKNFWKLGPDSDDVSCLSVDEIFSLKDIIARELEALSFVRELGREFEGSKNSFKKLSDGESVNM